MFHLFFFFKTFGAPGTSATGAITAIYTVLVEGIMNEPVADAVRGFLMGILY